MHGILCDKVKIQKCSSLDYSRYIRVHTGMYRYRQVQTSTKQHTSFDHAAMHAPSALLVRPGPMSLCRILGLVSIHCLLPHHSLVHSQATQAYDGFLGDVICQSICHKICWKICNKICTICNYIIKYAEYANKEICKICCICKICRIICK